MDSAILQQTLKTYFGYDSFRPLQEDIIQTILGDQDCLAIIPTGGGKSLCFQIPGLILEGTTIVISPLISLMENQVQQLKKRGLAAAQLSSSLSAAKKKVVEQQVLASKLQFIYLSPEQLQTKKWLMLSANLKIPLVVIDEAHCISQWGHDFRPPYRQIATWVQKLPTKPKIAAFTATATPQTAADIVASLQLQNVQTLRQDSLPEHLWQAVIDCPDRFHRWLRLFQLLKKHHNQSGIIYTLTRKATEEITTIISQLLPEIKVAFYHGGMTAKDRSKIQQQFIDNQLDVIVATNAFGMGVDKSNIRFVIHFHTPNSIEAYVQEIGRAGRDREDAWCYLLHQSNDQKINLDLLGKDQRKIEKYKWLLSLLTNKKCIKKNTATYFGLKYDHNCSKCTRCCEIKTSEEKLANEHKQILSLIKVISKNNNLKPSSVLSQKQAALLTTLKPKNLAQIKNTPGFGQGWIEKIWPLLKNDRIYTAIINKTESTNDN